jgi:hypothetical protein
MERTLGVAVRLCGAFHQRALFYRIRYNNFDFSLGSWEGEHDNDRYDYTQQPKIALNQNGESKTRAA